eukprot:458659_1
MVVQYLYSFSYVESLCRVSKFHYNIGLNEEALLPTLKMMILREFDTNMYEKHTKGQQHKIYKCIRWLYGLFRNSDELTKDNFFNLEHNGNRMNSLNRTYYLMSHAPKLLFPITYSFEKYLQQYSCISSMVWHFEFNETENIFEWMMKLLFAGNAPTSLIADFYSFIMVKYGDANDAYFGSRCGVNMYLMLYNMMHKLVDCQPHHVSFWFEIICIPRVKKWFTQNKMSKTSVGRFLDVMITGLHDRTCKQCHDKDNNAIILNDNTWEPDAWIELLLSDNTRQHLQFIGEIVDVKHNSATRNGWDFLKQPCQEYRQILRKIFHVEYFENFETERLTAMGIPKKLQKYKFLFHQCNVLTNRSREKIISFLTGKYMRNDVDSEDIVLNRIEEVKQSNEIKVIESIFRMFFKLKKWKPVKRTTTKSSRK